MPHGAEWLVFLGSTAVFALLPGPGVLYVLARALRGGRAEGVRAAAGTATGAMVHVTAASIGLSAVLAASAQAFTVVKIAGGAYLVFLGLHALLSKSDPVVDVRPTRRGAVAQGVLTEVFNPKTALFFLAFLPHFVHAGRGIAPPLVFVALGLVVVVLGLAVDLGVGFAAGTLGAKLAAHPRWYARQRAAAGVVMIGAGAALVAADEH